MSLVCFSNNRWNSQIQNITVYNSLVVKNNFTFHQPLSIHISIKVKKIPPTMPGLYQQSLISEVNRSAFVLYCYESLMCFLTFKLFELFIK